MISIKYCSLTPVLRMCCPISSVCIMKVDERADESDQTGDSGMGTGSGATKYGTIEEWKEAIQNPPPGMCIYCCIL